MVEALLGTAKHRDAVFAPTFGNGPDTLRGIHAGDLVIPREHLKPLVHGLKMTAMEWRVTIAVLAEPTPITARELSKRLRVDYSAIKRVVRGLVAWQVLLASPAGLRFQPDSTRWREPTGAEKLPRTGDKGRS